MRRVYLVLALAACTPEGKPEIYTNRVQGEIGGACATDEDCHGGGTCMTTHFAGSKTAAPGGYCTRTCSGDSDCGTGKCVQDWEDNKFYCMAFCEVAGNCRENYVCLNEKHCEPFDRYPLTCDPKENGGTCEDAKGRPGGCRRWAIGTGPAGICFTRCFGATDCDTGGGCYYVDQAQAHGDPFQGTVCIFPAGTVPTGGHCEFSIECASYQACILDDSTCYQLCPNPGGTCGNGLMCHNFLQPKVVGYCDVPF